VTNEATVAEAQEVETFYFKYILKRKKMTMKGKGLSRFGGMTRYFKASALKMLRLGTVWC